MKILRCGTVICLAVAFISCGVPGLSYNGSDADMVVHRYAVQ